MKGGKYAKTLAKIKVRAIFHMQDIWRNVQVHLYGHQRDGWKPTETSVTELCYKNLNLSLKELINVESTCHTFFSYMNCSDSKIPRNRLSCKCRITQKLRNSRILYHKTKNPFKAKFEWIFIVFAALIQHESKISVESIVLLSLNFSDVM